MKKYIIPATIALKVKTQSNLLEFSLNTTERNGGDALGKEGMTPVSEDNASSIWED